MSAELRLSLCAGNNLHTYVRTHMASASSSSSSSASSPASEEELTVSVKWVGKDYTVRLCAEDTVGELKRRICEVTNVLPKRQKLLNLKLGSRPAEDSVILSQIPLKPNVKIMMLGYVSCHLLVSLHFCLHT